MPLAWEPSLRLVLASSSPQRAAILGAAGIPFEVVPTGVAEVTEGEPGLVALENARLKARAGQRLRPGPEAVVLAADTVVALDGEIIDKPAGRGEALRAVGSLAGRSHEVHGGVVVAGPGDQWREASLVSRVSFRPLTGDEVREYVATGEWEGRAGGYAIQLAGAGLVESVEGDRENVIGLSTAALSGLVQGLVPAGGQAGDRYNPPGPGP